MRIRSTRGEGFSSVSGGVKGGFTKLEGGVMLWFCVIEACDVDIAARCTASRSCTRVIARTGRGDRSQLSSDASLTQQNRLTAAKSDDIMIRRYVGKSAPSGADLFGNAHSDSRCRMPYFGPTCIPFRSSSNPISGQSRTMIYQLDPK